MKHQLARERQLLYFNLQDIRFFRSLYVVYTFLRHVYFFRLAPALRTIPYFLCAKVTAASNTSFRFFLCLFLLPYPTTPKHSIKSRNASSSYDSLFASTSITSGSSPPPGNMWRAGVVAIRAEAVAVAIRAEAGAVAM